MKGNGHRVISVKAGKGNLKLVRIPGVEPGFWAGSKSGGWLDVKGEVVCQVALAVTDGGSCRFDWRIDIHGKGETYRVDSGQDYTLEGAVKAMGFAAAKYC